MTEDSWRAAELIADSCIQMSLNKHPKSYANVNYYQDNMNHYYSAEERSIPQSSMSTGYKTGTPDKYSTR